MNSADENYTKTYPEKARHPSPHLAGKNRSCNRTGGRNRREVLCKEVELRRWNVIDPVALLVCGRDARIIDSELPGNKISVIAVGENK